MNRRQFPGTRAAVLAVDPDICVRGIPPFAKEAKDGAPGTRRLGTWSRNTRSLDFARDDRAREVTVASLRNQVDLLP